MPAKAPKISAAAQEQLRLLGEAVRRARKQQKVSAISTGEAAGISRITLYRIERGEPGVAIGAWVAVADALALRLDFAGAGTARKPTDLPERISLNQYPQLKKLAWQLAGVEDVSAREAFNLYERNWRHVDTAKLSAKEAGLIEALSISRGGGKLLV